MGLHQLEARDSGADVVVVQRALFGAVLAIASQVATRFGLSRPDREDFSQDVALKAYVRREQYCADRGSPAQWVAGIAYREAVTRLRKERLQPSISMVDALPLDVASDESTPEERVSKNDLADKLFAYIPSKERSVVIAHALEGQSLREIAVKQGIGIATAIARYDRGIAKLTAADERFRLQGVIPLGAAFLAESAANVNDGGPSRELFERAWSRAVELGIVNDAPEPEPPPSGSRRAEPAEKSPPATVPRPSPWLRRLGPFVGVLFGGAVAGHSVARCSQPTDSRDRIGLASVAGANAVIAREPAANATPTAEPAPSTTAVASSPPPLPVSRPEHARTDDDPIDMEKVLVNHGRSAFAAGHLVEALSKFADHAARFPNGQTARERERLWNKACKFYRNTHPLGDMPDVESRCAGRM